MALTNNTGTSSKNAQIIDQNIAKMLTIIKKLESNNPTTREREMIQKILEEFVQESPHSLKTFAPYMKSVKERII